MFHQAHELGMFTVLWCYLRNAAFKTKEADYHVSADLTGQANHLGVTIQADIIKQKLPENNGGSRRSFRQDRQEVYSDLTNRPSDRLDAVSSGELLHGPRRTHQLGRRSAGESDLKEAVKTAVINKRAAGWV